MISKTLQVPSRQTAIILSPEIHLLEPHEVPTVTPVLTISFWWSCQHLPNDPWCFVPPKLDFVPIISLSALKFSSTSVCLLQEGRLKSVVCLGY